MADVFDSLRQLQELDTKLYALKRQQADKPRELEQLKAELDAHQARLKESEDRVKSLQVAQKEKELDLQTWEGQIRKLQGQLFQVKTNKEYTIMQHEIDSSKADVSLLEETILKGFDEIDRAGRDRAERQQQLAQAQARLKTEQARIEQELAALQEQLDRLELERKTVAPTVPKTALGVYERILRSREGLALVPLVQESCGGCHRRLPPQVVNEVLLRAKIVTCESCNRILYHDAVAGG